MTIKYCYIILSKRSAELLLEVIKDYKYLKGVAEQLEKQEPAPAPHPKSFWQAMTKAELVEQAMLHDRLVQYAGDKLSKLHKEGIYEKKNSKA